MYLISTTDSLSRFTLFSRMKSSVFSRSFIERRVTWEYLSPIVWRTAPKQDIAMSVGCCIERISERSPFSNSVFIKEMASSLYYQVMLNRRRQMISPKIGRSGSAFFNFAPARISAFSLSESY